MQGRLLAAAVAALIALALPGTASAAIFTVTTTLASPLPAITQPVVVDGSSQDMGIPQPVTIAGAANAGLAVAGAGGTNAATATQLFGFRLTGFTGSALTVTGSYALLQDSVVDTNTGDGVAFGAGG